MIGQWLLWSLSNTDHQWNKNNKIPKGICYKIETTITIKPLVSRKIEKESNDWRLSEIWLTYPSVTPSTMKTHSHFIFIYNNMQPKTSISMFHIFWRERSLTSGVQISLWIFFKFTPNSWWWDAVIRKKRPVTHCVRLFTTKDAASAMILFSTDSIDSIDYLFLISKFKIKYYIIRCYSSRVHSRFPTLYSPIKWAIQFRLNYLIFSSYSINLSPMTSPRS